MMRLPIEELESLLIEWESGTMTTDQTERLREILRDDAEAQKYFVRSQMLTAALASENETGLSPSLSHDEDVDLDPTKSVRSKNAQPAKTSPRRTRTSSRLFVWFAAAAAVVICVQAARLLYLENQLEGRGASRIATVIPPSERDGAGEATSSGIAIIKSLVDVTWESDQEPIDVGDALSPGRFSIASGLAQIEFFCGATVIVEGPAEIDLETPMLARVHQGRLRAQVPTAARGFSIDVADLKVVDLGTEFGISVSPEGTDVQVFDGEVELHQPTHEKRTLTTGQAIVRREQGEMQDAQVSPERFVDIVALESKQREQEVTRFRRWQSYSEKLRRDERLIAYYAFDQQEPWQRQLQSSADPYDEELDGAIVGANQVPGRWNQKGALEFKKPGDRVRVQIPGQFESLTLAAWVKIDSLDRWYNSLFLTDHYNQGEPHWQILDTGQLFFSVRHKADDARGPQARKQTHQPVLSPPFWNPSLSGRWIHLATTYNAQNGQTIHYFNGKPIHRESIAEDLVVKRTKIGAASIGNWSIPTRKDAEFAIRNLNGSLDEFAVFADALSAQEIQEMYLHGKP